jgi:serine/threonine-protein kinase
LLSTGRDLVKVLDFGLAKSLQPDAKQTMVTNEGQLLGTPAFMPPELVSGIACDGRADLYSLGCIMYRALSGSLPFSGASAHEIIAMHVTEPPKPIPNIPPALWTIVERLLAKDPDHRYQTAVQAREALEDCLGGGDADSVAPTTVSSKTPGTMLGWDVQSSPSISRTPSKPLPALPKPALPKPPLPQMTAPMIAPPRPTPTPTQIRNTQTPKSVYVIMAVALMVIAAAVIYALARG